MPASLATDAAGSRLEDCANDKLTPPNRIVACTNVLEDRATSVGDRAIAHFNRAYALDGTGDYDRAIADYNSVIELDPKDADAFTTGA